MAPKKRTYSNVSQSSDDETTNVSSRAAPGLSSGALSAPAAAAPHNGPAAPQAAHALPITTPTRPAASPLTKSQQKRLGMSNFSNPEGGPTARGSSYGYENRMPIDGHPDFLNPVQRAEVERRRAAESMASASQQPGMSSTSTFNVPNTPTPHQQGTRVQNPLTQTPSSQPYSNVFHNQPPAIGQYGATSLPRPTVGDPSGAFQPSPLPRSGLYGNHNAGIRPAGSSAPTWRGSSYANSDTHDGSDAASRAPSRAAGLAALSNIPGDPAYNPPAVPSIRGGAYWTSNAATGARDDPFTSAHTMSSNWPEVAGSQQQTGSTGSLYNQQPALQQPWHAQSYQAGTRLPGIERQGRGDAGFRGATTARADDVPQHLLRPSNQHDGFEPPFAPTSRTNDPIADRHPHTEPHVPSDLNQEFDWRVSPNPDLDDVVARASTAVPARDAHARPEDDPSEAQQEPEMTQADDSADSQAQQAQSFSPINTGAAPSGHGDTSDVGAATHAQEAFSG
ncbi:hypothetical protein CB0940_09646 [Cercospora beticola]|uniref:Uncharacterized protein n=1 Tax=Cercospora beticola TaxID=122368 RepID=A0A2G5HIB5_CERBT|nr:hypothetical protein CB0940_09646 [Cercospora beticola]PIA92269.1 hypothetical protein CB0940_09646 [Cercospora beticola]WPB06017.1 hypothetical protein RHO25_010672 [Cercospora beticola]